MISMDEDNYEEATEAAFKVFAPRGISKYTSRLALVETGHKIYLFYICWKSWLDNPKTALRTKWTTFNYIHEYDCLLIIAYAS